MKTKHFIIISVIFILFIGFQQYLIWTSPPKTEDVLLQKITELESKVDSLNTNKDSIRRIIDSTHVKIVTNEKHYQERINTIILQSSSADSSFIANYIRQYRSKNDSINI